LALWSDPETVRFIGGQVQDAQAVWFRMLRYAGMWALLGFGYWLFQDKESGRFVGEGGLADMRRGIAGLEGVPEMGWAVRPYAAGKGYATEAGQAICHWADTVLATPSLRCIIEPANLASIRVAEKIGFSVIEIGRAHV
jgi:RimJ/RimL family protein N-acetyltransferase